MKFHLADDDTFRLSELHPLELRFLKQAPLMADPEGSPEARSRLFPDPLAKHRARKGEEAEEKTDWEEFVVPGLESRFESAVQVVDRDLDQVDFEEGWNAEFDEIIVPVQHAEQWYLTLNQARLVMAERFQLHGPSGDILLIPPDDDDDGAEDSGSHDSISSLHEDPPRPKIAILTFIQYRILRPPPDLPLGSVFVSKVRTMAGHSMVVLETPVRGRSNSLPHHPERDAEDPCKMNASLTVLSARSILFSMSDFGSSDSRLLLKVAIPIAGVVVAVLVLTDGNRATGQVAQAPSPSDSPSDSASNDFVELASYMGELQRLTHKLSLAVKHENYPLASFYLYESLESLEDIKTEVPEYRGLPIALLIDQLSTKRYEELKQALKQDETDDAKPKRAPVALTALVNSCNQCHVATKHEFIKITVRGDFNPFNQDFKP